MVGNNGNLKCGAVTIWFRSPHKFQSEQTTRVAFAVCVENFNGVFDVIGDDDDDDDATETLKQFYEPCESMRVAVGQVLIGRRTSGIIAVCTSKVS